MNGHALSIRQLASDGASPHPLNLSSLTMSAHSHHQAPTKIEVREYVLDMVKQLADMAARAGDKELAYYLRGLGGATKLRRSSKGGRMQPNYHRSPTHVAVASSQRNRE